MNITRCLALLLVLASLSAHAQHPYTKSQVISYAKSIDAKTLDQSLPSQHLEDWLKSASPKARIRWDVSDTCDNHPFRNEDFPLCAKIWFSREGVAGSLLIQVGRLHKGLVGAPQLYAPILAWEEDSFFITVGDAERLSELPDLLKKPAFAHVVGHLYDEVVAHHPIGVPEGAQMSAIAPFLSKRLNEQLQFAKACEKDYFQQQHQTADLSQKPTWLKTGLFSGDGSRALPASAFPVRDGLQKDGSFLVYVNLFAQAIDLGNGLKGGSGAPGGSYRVAVKVIPENGQFVVDDVRLFDGPSTDGPSRLLSESFAGCKGPRWVGLP